MLLCTNTFYFGLCLFLSTNLASFFISSRDLWSTTSKLSLESLSDWAWNETLFELLYDISKLFLLGSVEFRRIDCLLDSLFFLLKRLYCFSYCFCDFDYFPSCSISGSWAYSILWSMIGTWLCDYGTSWNFWHTLCFTSFFYLFSGEGIVCSLGYTHIVPIF